MTRRPALRLHYLAPALGSQKKGVPGLTTSHPSLTCSGVRVTQPLRTEVHPSPVQLTVPLQLTCSGGTPWEPAGPGPLRSRAFSGEDPATPTTPQLALGLLPPNCIPRSAVWAAESMAALRPG